MLNMALLSQQPIGESPLFHALMDRVSDVASLDKPVLLVGERGTGKELIASRLHFLSPRWEQLYISLNCAAYTEAELEVQLFGGVARDGHTDIDSIFIRGDGGTVFLDHIDSCSGRLQEKLLQTLERGAIYNGDDNPAEFDVRLVTATSENLPLSAQEGRFCPDLIGRIAFHVLGLPPLRARPEDISPLSQHFGRKIVSSLGAERFSGFTPEAMARLMAQPWQGNVRELKLCVERSVAQAYLADESLLMPIDELVLDPFANAFHVSPANNAPPPNQSLAPPAAITNASSSSAVPVAAPQTTDFQSRVMIFERGLIDEALTRAQGHQGRAADYLALSYHQFRGLLRKHGLKK